MIPYIIIWKKDFFKLDSGESKVFQYFGNVRHKLTALDAKVMKTMNYIRLWYIELA